MFNFVDFHASLQVNHELTKDDFVSPIIFCLMWLEIYQGQGLFAFTVVDGTLVLVHRVGNKIRVVASTKEADKYRIGSAEKTDDGIAAKEGTVVITQEDLGVLINEMLQKTD